MRLSRFVIFASLFAIAPTCVAENPPEIAMLLGGMSNPYWKTLYDGAVETADELGIDVYVQGIQSNTDPEAQLNICNTMLLRKPKALIFAALNNVNLSPCLTKATAQGIRLIDVDGGTGKAEAEKMGIDLTFSVASDNYALGKKAAEYLNGLSGKVLLIEGFPGSVPAELRKKGFQENLSPQLQIIASLPGDWDRLKAADITRTTIMKHPDLTAVFAANDLMALGAAEAVLEGKKGNVKVVGVDGISDAVSAIQSGRLTASIAQLPYLMGSEAVRKTHQFISGEATFEFNQTVPIIALDREVLKAKTEPLLKYLR